MGLLRHRLRRVCGSLVNRIRCLQGLLDGNRINQGIAEKLFTCVQGISLFFSAYIVALAVQWKLALITMSIVPAIVLTVGFCLSVDAPVEARIVSCIASVVRQCVPDNPSYAGTNLLSRSSPYSGCNKLH